MDGQDERTNVVDRFSEDTGVRLVPERPAAPEAAAPGAPSISLLEPAVVALLQIALRTEPGRAYWEGYICHLLPEHPWLAGDLLFRPGAGVVVPRPTATGPNGRP